MASLSPVLAGEKTIDEIILNDRGKKFDPDIVDAFMANQKEIDAIRQRLCQATTTS